MLESKPFKRSPQGSLHSLLQSLGLATSLGADHSLLDTGAEFKLDSAIKRHGSETSTHHWQRPSRPAADGTAYRPILRLHGTDGTLATLFLLSHTHSTSLFSASSRVAVCGSSGVKAPALATTSCWARPPPGSTLILADCNCRPTQTPLAGAISTSSPLSLSTSARPACRCRRRLAVWGRSGESTAALARTS